MLAYGLIGDLVDENMLLNESTCLDSVYKFSKVVVQVFSKEYPRE
jgi:hypothetical protein